MKRMVSIERPVVVGGADLPGPDAIRLAHDTHGWHVLEKDRPTYAPGAARAWLVCGRRAAFLCVDEAGWYIFEYAAEEVS